jgi:hypothetical protein
MQPDEILASAKSLFLASETENGDCPLSRLTAPEQSFALFRLERRLCCEDFYGSY